jgi:pimeloyl-ACP methyl ester carboxylesterase
VNQLRLDREDVSLSAVDFGGHGSPVVLLHGLAGYAGEWTDTGAWLRERHRVVAVEHRGHGASSRTPSAVATESFVEDVVAWFDALRFERTSLVGQSFGGLIAFLAAAFHPDRVTRLVVAEASPAADPGVEAEVREWLEQWPVPFPDEAAAIRFFGGDSVRARAWVDGLEVRQEGLYPRFDADTVLSALREAALGWWDAWSFIRCPTLIVRGEHGLAGETAQEMAAQVGVAAVATIRGAGHDVHLEDPGEWRRIVQPFLDVSTQ